LLTISSAPAAPTPLSLPTSAPPQPIFNFPQPAPSSQPVLSFSKANESTSAEQASQPSLSLTGSQPDPSSTQAAKLAAPNVPFSGASLPAFNFTSTTPISSPQPKPSAPPPPATAAPKQRDSTPKIDLFTPPQVTPKPPAPRDTSATSPKSTSADLFDPQAKSQKPPLDRQHQVDLLVRLAFTQRYGLVFQFLEATLPAILREEARKFERQQFEEAISEYIPRRDTVPSLTFESTTKSSIPLP
jgi:hypothetical protein